MDLSKLKAFADDNLNVTKTLKFALGRVENIAGKGEKMLVTSISLFPTMFSKAFLSRGVKSRDSVVKS